jgi:hypothetical protein
MLEEFIAVQLNLLTCELINAKRDTKVFYKTNHISLINLDNLKNYNFKINNNIYDYKISLLYM